jgi:hypothetical protein
MNQKPDEQVGAVAEDLDALESKLQAADAADAPEAAEQVARLLGSALDDIQGARGAANPD